MILSGDHAEFAMKRKLAGKGGDMLPQRCPVSIEKSYCFADRDLIQRHR